MITKSSQFLSLSIAAAVLAACGGGSGGVAGSATSGTPAPTTPPVSTPQTATVPLVLSDASSEDWATIGVKVLSIALVPQGGGSNVVVYTAPTPAPLVNLVQLDQIAELLGNVTVPVGTYSAAVLTVSGNPGDILLTAAADPATGFAAAAGSTIPASAIQVQHTQGATGSLTVPVNVDFVSPLVVSTSQSNALDLEFNLAHPAFLIGHVAPGSAGTIWAVNFNGPVVHHPIHDLNRLVLRHTYGTVTALSSDDTSLTITKDFPTLPAVTPETAVVGTQSLQILADASNGTLFYDMDAKTKTVITSFSSETSVTGKYVRIAARYQEDGTLVATRIWASSTFNTVWVSPEGHVLHVNPSTDVIQVASESGTSVPLTIDANTQFYFRQPQNPAADAMPIATGTAFITNADLVRGFKIHASVVDPLATPLVAQSIDIETAEYSGSISASTASSFVYHRAFHSATDDYMITLPYLNAATANGTDDSGNAITGYKWWNFAFPTLLTSGTSAVADWVSSTDGSVSFGGTYGTVPTYGTSFAIWGDPSAPVGWSAAASIVMPSLLPLGSVASGLAAGNTFTLNVPGGSAAASVEVDTAAGSATLVYQVDRTNGIVTVSAIDVTTSTGLASLASGLAMNAPVRVYGVPRSDGSLRAYVLTYYTGEMPIQ